MTKIKTPITPIANSNSVSLIKERINSSYEPQYVKVSPVQNAPILECFDIVDEHIAKNGGNRILGWALWELPSFFIEAEFHAIWESPSGDLVDLVPRSTPTSRILFIRDKDMLYEGLRVNNIRINYSNNHIIEDLFKIYDEEFAVFGPEGIVFQHQQFLDYSFKMRKVSVHERMELIYKHLKKSDPCFCNSGEMLKNCHRKY